jgi:putative oxidoreductase
MLCPHHKGIAELACDLKAENPKMFVRKDKLMSSLQSPHNSEAQVTSIDDYARWLSRVTLVVAIIMIGWGSSVILVQSVTAWFIASTTVFMALLLISAIWHLRGSLLAIAALALTTAVVSRLFSILNLNPPTSIVGLKPDDLDLLVATGPGVPGFELLGWFLGALVFVQFLLRSASIVAAADSRGEALNASALFFIRVYVGLMFVPHLGSHLLGGPFQFKIYTLYFESLGLHSPAMQVALAGTIELVSAVGLSLGIFTRPVALLASVYLLMSMLWGGHFQVGYVWALPNGGYEFGVFWAAMIAVFAALGGGRYSADKDLWLSKASRRIVPGVVRKVLAAY